MSLAEITAPEIILVSAVRVFHPEVIHAGGIGVVEENHGAKRAGQSGGAQHVAAPGILRAVNGDVEVGDRPASVVEDPEIAAVRGLGAENYRQQSDRD